tara:strand:+ start:134 stop:286 length:153 start_codon:yes stop_codon:yes gene_type:complete
MKLIKVGCAMGLSGCRKSDEVEVEDDATGEQIKEAAREWAMEQFEWWVER